MVNEQFISEVIEVFFSLGLFVNAALFIPQLIKLYQTKNSHGLSLVTFGGFSVIQLFTIAHGLIHKDYILTIGYLLSFLICTSVVVLIVLYRRES